MDTTDTTHSKPLETEFCADYYKWLRLQTV